MTVSPVKEPQFEDDFYSLPEGAIGVLDKGFVKLVDSMGSDDRIVQTARVSYGAGTKTKREDKALIRYLLRNKHTSPFEQVVLTFHVKMPLFVARQWTRHRTARLNELSGRYSVMKDEFYVPDTLAHQSTLNKQGAGLPFSAEETAPLIEDLIREQEGAYDAYSDRLDLGVSREQARVNLPLSLYTEMYWQIDLHNLFHFLRLRLDTHAQSEIRAYAAALAHFARDVAPIAYDAFIDYSLESLTLSRLDVAAMRQVNRRVALEGGVSTTAIREMGAQEGMGKTEADDFVHKATLLL